MSLQIEQLLNYSVSQWVSLNDFVNTSVVEKFWAKIQMLRIHFSANYVKFSFRGTLPRFNLPQRHYEELYFMHVSKVRHYIGSYICNKCNLLYGNPCSSSQLKCETKSYLIKLFHKYQDNWVGNTVLAIHSFCELALWRDFCS